MFSQKDYQEYCVASSLTRFFVCLSVLFVLGACNPTPQTISQSPTDTDAALEVSPTVTTSTPETAVETSTPEPTAVVVTPSHPPVSPTETIQATTTPTSEPAIEQVTGQLFVYTPTGIQRAPLPDGTFQFLLTAEAEWLDWGARFAQNRKYLAYWVKNTNGTELWFTSLPQWQPQRILEIEEVEYDFATPLWAVNDRYLLFNLSVLDNSGPLEDIKTIRTYIIDMETMELVNQSYWPGDCSILAASPQTSQLALWCYKSEEAAGMPEFLVLEPDEVPWLTQQAPDILIDDCLIFLICAWSQDGEFVTYIVTDDHPDSLFYTTVDNPMPVRLDDERTQYSSFPAWSPDSLFLYYGGECIDAGECPNVMSVVDQEIIWRARRDNNWGEEDIAVNLVVWSPNSRYLAIPISAKTDSGLEKQILLFEVLSRQEVWRISKIGGAILDMVWVID